MKDWNPRYVEYAKAHGRTPEAQLAYDKEELPGACMMEFMLWNSTKIREWRATLPGGTPMHETEPNSPEMHAAYNAWLRERKEQAGGTQ